MLPGLASSMVEQSFHKIALQRTRTCFSCRNGTSCVKLRTSSGTTSILWKNISDFRAIYWRQAVAIFLSKQKGHIAWTIWPNDVIWLVWHHTNLKPYTSSTTSNLMASFRNELLIKASVDIMWTSSHQAKIWIRHPHIKRGAEERILGWRKALLLNS